MKDKDWKGIDKLKHMGVCLGLSIVCPPLAIGAAVWKEWYDKKSYGHWCWWDLAADAVGIVAGSAVHYGVMLAII